MKNYIDIYNQDRYNMFNVNEKRIKGEVLIAKRKAINSTIILKVSL